MRSLLVTLFGLWGAAVATAAGLHLLDVALVCSRGTSADGVVYDYRPVRQSNDGESAGAPRLYPLIRFETDDGKEVRFMDPHGARAPRYRLGTAVRVVYPQDSPQAAVVVDGVAALLWATVALLTGAGFAAACGAWIVKCYRGERSEMELQRRLSNSIALRVRQHAGVNRPNEDGRSDGAAMGAKR